MRVALGVEYDGSNWHGWQRQHHSSSVQEELERALSAIADAPIDTVCAGRTDTGVHGAGQVVHFDTAAQRDARNWVRGCNSRLPNTIAVQWAKAVPDDFHARYSALWRRYQYVILNAPVRSALQQGRVALQHRPLDAQRMHKAAQALLGEHDFTSFRAAGCQSKSAIREVQKISVLRQADKVVLDIQANAFLMHMVRNIVGSLMVIGTGEQPVAWLAELLQARDRKLAGTAAPAAGLCLVEVGYPAQYDLPQAPLRRSDCG